jgi:hypothetical protein
MDCVFWCVLWFVVWGLVITIYGAYLEGRRKSLREQQIITQRLLEIRGEEPTP